MPLRPLWAQEEEGPVRPDCLSQSSLVGLASSLRRHQESHKAGRLNLTSQTGPVGLGLLGLPKEEGPVRPD